MKKQLHNYLLAFLFFGIQFAQAQITVTRNDFANVNDIAVDAYDTLTGISPGSGGASQTWDFSALANHYADTNYFMAPSVTPYASTFASANIAAYNSLDSTYAFIDANTNILNIVGYVAPNPFTGSPLALSFSPPVTQVTFPSTVSTAFNVNNATAVSTFYYSGTYLTFTFDSVRTTTIVNRTSNVDGWGTTITPVGTFSSLRQKMTDITDIAIEAYLTTPALGWTPVPLGQTDTTVHYYYIANGQNWPVAEIQTNYSGATTSAQYLLNATNSVPEINASGKDIIIYPNPSTGEFNVSSLSNKAVVLKIFDIDGKELERIAIDNSLRSFSVKSLAAGIYLFRVFDKTGSVIDTGKIAVQK